MNLTKIKFNKGKIEIEYEKCDRETDSKKTQFCSYDEPLPSFKDALQAMALHAEEICEFPAGFFTAPSAETGDGEVIRQKGRVLGVSFSYADKDGIMGASITVLRELITSQAPLVINTPHLAEAEYSEGSSQPLLTDDCVRALYALKDEAMKYLNGERAVKQPSLLDQVPPDPEIAWNGPDPEPITITHDQAKRIEQNINRLKKKA
jgi:hypothetical protein